MTDPIERRLRDSLSRHAGDVTPATDGWLAIRERAAREDHRLGRRRRTFRLAASGALAALVAVAVPLSLDRIRSGDDGVAFSPPPPITAETTTAAPTPTEPPAPVTASPTPAPVPAAAPVWTAVDDGGALTPGPYVYVRDAAAQGSRVVAVGSFSPSDDATQAVVWFADDGEDWRAADGAGRFGGDPGTYTEAVGVAATSRGFIAVGATYAGDEADLPIAWASPDGSVWEPIELPGDGRANAVTEVTGGALVVVGGFGPTIWTSADGGATWERTELDLLGDEGAFDHVESVGERVVAMGRSSVAVSEDGGGSWNQIPHPAAGLPQNVEDLVVLGDGSLAGVVATDSGLVAYTSADGTAWEPAAPFPSSPQESNQRVAQIAALPDGTLVAAGFAYDIGAGEIGAVWASTDGGHTWVRDEGAAFGQGSELAALASTDTTLVALGVAESGADGGGRAWTRPLP